MAEQNILITEINYSDPLLIFNRFADHSGSIFLDSALHSAGYSYIAVDPFMTLYSKNGVIHFNNQKINDDPFKLLQQQLVFFQQETQPDLPLFQGGVAGYFGYDLCHHLEKLPRHSTDDMEFPDLALGFYDLVMAFDHSQQKAWIFSNGFPETDLAKRKIRAQKRCDWLMDQLINRCDLPMTSTSVCAANAIFSNFSHAQYLKAVQQVIDYIYAGDIFQVNLSQRFKADLPNNLTPFQLYCRLRNLSHAPFSSYLNFANTVIASASPERFLKLTANAVITSPIKGTRPRSNDSVQDQLLANELCQSEKDRAENIMIVDLMRNDLSRVCENHSVNVTQLCALESFTSVHHLVSTITGQLQKQKNATDLLRATLPGGSITGAPKIRAMEIIAELEPTQRGPYCGCIGYIGFNGDMDTAMTIRSYAIKNNKATFQVGGGIVADSDPEKEYQETLVKAKNLFHALTLI